MTHFIVAKKEDLCMVREIRRQGYSSLSEKNAVFTPELIARLSEPESDPEKYIHILALKDGEPIGCVTINTPANPDEIHSSTLFNLNLKPGIRAGEILKLFVLNPESNAIIGFNLIFAAFEELRKMSIADIFMNFLEERLEFYLRFGDIIATKSTRLYSVYCLRVDIARVERNYAALFKRFRENSPLEQLAKSA